VLGHVAHLLLNQATQGFDGGHGHSCTQTSRKGGWDGVELEPQND